VSRLYGGSLRCAEREPFKPEGSHWFMTSTGTNGERWFALQVRTRWETSTAVLLSGKGYRTCLPTHKTRKRWKGRVTEVDSALFPGYVFCHFDAQNRLPILITPGVISVVGQGRIPLPVDEGEMAAIQAVVASGYRVEPWPYLELGQRVRIEQDSLQGLEGMLVNFKGNHRVVVSVSLLRRSVALEIDRACVTSVSPALAEVRGSIAAHPLLQGVVA
jgi:transcription antitermination factor NusG